jgi:hypothetical protein
MQKNRWRSGYFVIEDEHFVGYLTATGTAQDTLVRFGLERMQRIMEASQDIQVEVPNEYLIGSLRHDDKGYLTADVIMYNKVVRLKLTQEQIDIAKNISLYNKK